VNNTDENIEGRASARYTRRVGAFFNAYGDAGVDDMRFALRLRGELDRLALQTFQSDEDFARAFDEMTLALRGDDPGKPREEARSVRALLDRVEGGGLGTQELTFVLPLSRRGLRHPISELHAALRELDARERSPLADVPGLHSASFVLSDQADEGSIAAEVAVPSGSLVFSCVIDGDPLDVLRAMVERLGFRVRDVLAHCEGFPEAAGVEAIARYLEGARVRTGYFFSDVDATRTEILEALALKDRFVEFHANHRVGIEPRPLRAAFRELLGNAGPRSTRKQTAGSIPDAPAFGYPFSLSSPFEQSVPSELKWVRRVVELTLRLQDRDVYEARLTNSRARRGRVAHNKHHGTVKATFTVRDDVPDELRHGVFQPGRTFDALIRSSNTSNVPRPDGDFDGRGIAIKLLNVGEMGRPVVDDPLPDGLPDGAGSISQDFLLLNHPVFFVKDIRDFGLLRSNLDVGTKAERATRMLVFLARRPREFAIFCKTFFTKIEHPFAIDYHSTVPSLLGPRLAVKYSVSPRPGQQPFGPPADRKNPEYLRDILQTTLDPDCGRAIELDFFLHVANGGSFPIEDATRDWDELGARKVEVARIRIEPQNFTTDALLQFSEDLVFTPWHALEAHKPLGSLSRARYAIYRASMEGRKADAAKRGEVAGAA
jgi:hypothetical protein